MKPVKNIGLPELTSEQVEELCSIAEEAARKHVLSKISIKKIETLGISAEVKGEKPLTLSVEVNISPSLEIENSYIQKLAEEAVKEAFASAEKYLKELKCRSHK